MTVSQEFIEHCHAKAARFLKSVVIVDDEISWENLPDPSSRLAAKPNAWSAIEGNVPALIPSLEETTEIISRADSNVEIDAFTRSFAQHGIVAGFLKPNFDQDDNQKIVKDITKLSEAADVLLIDWKLNGGATVGEEHKLTIEAIKSILLKDALTGGRVRLIVIYTSESSDIVRRQLLEGIQEPKLTLETEDPDDRLKTTTCFSYGHGLLAIVSKSEIKYSAGVNPQVHDVVVRLFSKLNRGLLASTALDAIAVIREKTHHLLSQFSQEFDGAFVAHRCLIASPEDSEEFAEKLISDEMRVAIALQRVGTSGLGHENINRWADSHQHSSKEGIKTLSELYSKDKEKRAKGILGTKQLPELIKKFFPKGVNDEGIPSAINHFSSMSLLETDLTKLKSYGKNWSPYLTLGSVLRSKNKYFLCMMPRCDSVRIDSRRAFPLLQLDTVGTNEGQFNLVVPQDNSFVRLLVTPSSDRLVIVEFDPNESGYVATKPTNDQYFFVGHTQNDTNAVALVRRKFRQIRATSKQGTSRRALPQKHESINNPVAEDVGKKSFEWVAELRSDKALQFAQALSTQLDRVGLDDFEPLRLLSRKN